MAINLCLIPSQVDAFRKALKSKDLSIPSMLDMTTEERIALLEPYAGARAKEVNLLFEKKLVLKNRMIGIRNWASKMGEVGRYSPEQMAETKVRITEYQRMQEERIFSPKENESFLASLAENELDIEITRDEAAKVFEASRAVDAALEKKNEDGSWKTAEDAIEYGKLKFQYETYLAQLQGEELPFTEILKGRKQEFVNTWGDNKAKAVFDVGLDTLSLLSNTAVALKASIDASFIGRQGQKMFLRDITTGNLWGEKSIWAPAAANSFRNIWKELNGTDAMKGIMIDYYSRENNLNGEYQKSGLVPVIEEEIPSSIPERIPYVGRAFKASEVAFKGAALEMRMGLYDLMRNAQKNAGVDMKDAKYIRDTGKIVNSLTARGKWGKVGESAIVKLIMWSPRMLKANLDVLTAHGAGIGLETSYGRKEAALNLLRVVGSLGLLMLLLGKLFPDTVEWDPRSSNFGQITVGDTKVSRIIAAVADFVGLSGSTYAGKTHYDLTGGMRTIITLVARQLPSFLGGGRSKNATTGVVKKYGTGFGEISRMDGLLEFFMGKAAPFPRVVIDVLKGESFEGPVTPISVVEGLTVPISIQNVLGIFAPDTTAGTDWNESTGVTLKQFKEQVGQDRFNEANDLYNDRYTAWLKEEMKSEEWAEMDEEKKAALLTSERAKIKAQVFREYDFKYKRE